MILTLLAASLMTQGAVREVEVSRGATVTGAEPFTYWDCADTTLDATDPDANRGGEASLIGGSSSVILIRFGDLSRVLGQTRHIRKASIRLTSLSGEKPVLASAARVLQPWGEGPYQTVNATVALLGKQGAATPADKAASPKMSATWRAREAGYENGSWQQAGAKGPLDSTPIQEAQLIATDKDVEIQGLGPTFQWLADHPTHNCGIALSFSNSTEFFSAQAFGNRPRLELELDDASAPQGPDLSVIRIARRKGGGFVAHVKNVGDAASGPFDSVWSMNGRVGSTVGHADDLQPGQETVLTTTENPKADSADPRSGLVCFDIKPTKADANPRNDSLAVFSGARRLDFKLAPGLAELAKRAINQEGTHAIEDWIQAQVRTFNETYLAQSHFSFALDGSKERVAVQSIEGDPLDPSEEAGDAQVEVTPEMFGQGGFSIKLAHAIGLAIGLMDYDPMIVQPGSGKVTVPGAAERGAEDLCPGLMGGGDTRYDGSVPGVLMVPNQPSFNADDANPAEPTGLLAMTDVYMLDSRIGKPIAKGLPVGAPKAILLQARNSEQQPVTGATLSFYQSIGGKIPDGPPAFTLKLGDTGTAVIPNRDSKGIFGSVEPDGANGMLLVKAEAYGATDWAWIKDWQVVDAYARGIVSAGILAMNFNLPGAELDPTRNLASQKIVSDSTGQPPDKLESIVDGSAGSAVSLGQKPGDWVEIDLGRDRTLAEVQVSADQFWNSFDIVMYGTGQALKDAAVYARERNWAFTRRNRSDGASVAYMGPPVQVRYIRIISRSGGRSDLRKISVIAAKVSN